MLCLTLQIKALINISFVKKRAGVLDSNIIRGGGGHCTPKVKLTICEKAMKLVVSTVYY